MIIPPRVERYTVNAYCSQRCTNAVSAQLTMYIHSVVKVHIRSYRHVYMYVHIYHIIRQLVNGAWGTGSKV